MTRSADRQRWDGTFHTGYQPGAQSKEEKTASKSMKIEEMVKFFLGIKNISSKTREKKTERG